MGIVVFIVAIILIAVSIYLWRGYKRNHTISSIEDDEGEELEFTE